VSQEKHPGWLQRLWEKIVPHSEDFNALLLDQCRCLEQTLETLAGYLEDIGDDHATAVRQFVREGHALARRNLDILHRTFITPIDREDIYTLVTRLDHIFDYAKTAVREIELLVVRPDPWMIGMVEHLRQGAAALREGIAAFAVNPASAESLALKTRHAERHVEKLYRQALADMFSGESYQTLSQGEKQPQCRDCLDFLIHQMKRREVYRHLSNAADRLAHAGEALRDLSVKYG
jgi:uncharacterized protein Yka (UPF0111/DUF47 family)